MAKPNKPAPPKTPDRRYIVVRGRLWRAANPKLPAAKRQRLVQRLMRARSAVRQSTPGSEARRKARHAVNAAKIALGERGTIWWKDAPDYNRRLIRNTPYAAWWRKRKRPAKSAGRQKPKRKTNVSAARPPSCRPSRAGRGLPHPR